jgi:2'-5' RNA ligase
MREETQSALIVEVPQAESLVGRFRRRFDPSAAAGVPTHVTVLYPFLPPARLTSSVTRTLSRLFRDVAPFRARFDRARRFPAALYLAPVPASPFRRLTELVAGRFPEAPPYGGRFEEIVPHLTVAHAADPRELARIAREFSAAAREKLPVRMTVAEVVLIERRAGRWRKRRVFALGGAGIVRGRNRRRM